MSNYKVVGGDGQVYGPVTAEQLRQWVREGRADAHTKAQAEGAAEWQPLSAFPEFADLARPAVAAPPSAPPGPVPMRPPAPAPAGDIPNYLVPAILATIFCCLPFGIVSIVYAAQVNTKKTVGDIDGARAASKNAKMWFWISFGFGLFVALCYVAFYAVMILGAVARRH